MQSFSRSPLSDITLSETWTNRFVLKFTSNAYKWHSNSHYIFACFMLHIHSCSTSSEQDFTATDMAYSQPSAWNCFKISRQLTNIKYLTTTGSTKKEKEGHRRHSSQCLLSLWETNLTWLRSTSGSKLEIYRKWCTGERFISKFKNQKPLVQGNKN